MKFSFIQKYYIVIFILCSIFDQYYKGVSVLQNYDRIYDNNIIMIFYTEIIVEKSYLKNTKRPRRVPTT